MNEAIERVVDSPPIRFVRESETVHAIISSPPVSYTRESFKEAPPLTYGVIPFTFGGVGLIAFRAMTNEPPHMVEGHMPSPSYDNAFTQLEGFGMAVGPGLLGTHLQ